MEFDNIKVFGEFLGVQRGLSPGTVRGYRYDLRYYAEWLSAAGKTLGDVGPKDLDGYVRYMRGEMGLAPKTCKRRMAAVSTYHKWLVREGVLPNDPVHFIMLPKAAARLPVYLAEEEMARFEELVEGEAARRPIVGVRNRALMYLMMYGGLRISEALAIREGDIVLHGGVPVMVKVVGKGDKEREVDLADKAAAAVRSWMDVKKALREDDDLARKYTRKNRLEIASDYLFPGRDGRQMDRRPVQRKLEGLRGNFGGKKLTPHKLRHTFATALFRAKADIATIAELLGHASIATTQIYTHVEASQRREAVRRL
jgi:site-specific recombinase XerD